MSIVKYEIKLAIFSKKLYLHFIKLPLRDKICQKMSTVILFRWQDLIDCNRYSNVNVTTLKYALYIANNKPYKIMQYINSYEN